jgi:hypothetical protein
LDRNPNSYAYGDCNSDRDPDGYDNCDANGHTMTNHAYGEWLQGAGATHGGPLLERGEYD